MKLCSICKQVKPFSEFQRNRNKHKDGYHSECKICTSKSKRTERGRAINRRAIHRYQQKYPEKFKAIQDKYRLCHLERCNAKYAVNYAVKQGKIPCIKTRRCYFCYKQAEQYHHYKGYERKFWLDVIPVCRICHQENHRRIAI